MTMGTGVVLIVVGAVLAFAVHVENAFVNLATAGDILMVAGVVVFVIGLALAIRGRRTVLTSRLGGATGTTRQETVRTTDPGEL